MTIKQIHYFLAVAEAESFTHAARNYFIAQTAMSQQISALEKELGFLLFRRNNRSVSMTDAGKVLYRRLRPLVVEMEQAVEEASAVAGIQRQVFRIGMFDQAVNRFLAPALRAFAQQEPDASVELISDNHIMLQEAIVNRNLDVMLLGKQYYTPKSAIEAIELFTYQAPDYVLSVQKDSPLAEKDYLEWKDLNDLPLIVYTPFREDKQGMEMRSILQKKGVKANIIGTTRDFASALLYAEAGMACCLLPSRVGDMKNPQVVMISLDETKTDTMLLLHHKDNDSHLLSRFISVCRNTLHGT